MGRKKTSWVIQAKWYLQTKTGGESAGSKFHEPVRNHNEQKGRRVDPLIREGEDA